MIRRLRAGLVAAATAAVCLTASSPAVAAVPPTLNPGDLGSSGEQRDYGTPTPAKAKACPFTGDIPVNLPVAQPPVRTSIPAVADLDLSEPSVPSHIYGELCMSETALAAARAGNAPTVLVVLHGITYGTWYWDFPYQPETYSGVNHFIDHGYATLNIDRIGEGRSAHPISALTTAAAHADTVHQLIGKLRAGAIGGLGFDNVVTVGHSYGTVVAWLEAALFNDADATIGTGYTSRTNALNAANLVGTASPAATVSTTADEPWAVDPGYLQPRPGTRAIPELYHLEAADPQVIATDDRLANSVTAEELATFPPPQYDGTIKNKRIPTFAINGEFDNLTCGADMRYCAIDAASEDEPEALEPKAEAFREWEAPAHHSASCLRAAVVPDAAHDVNLHPNAHQLYDTIVHFANQAVGRHGENAEAYRAACASAPLSAADQLPETGRLVPPVPIDGVG